MGFQIKKDIPMPPPLRKNKYPWMDNITVGNSIHFDDHAEFENARRTLRHKGFQTQTRKYKHEWVIWITQDRD